MGGAETDLTVAERLTDLHKVRNSCLPGVEAAGIHLKPGTVIKVSLVEQVIFDLPGAQVRIHFRYQDGRGSHGSVEPVPYFPVLLFFPVIIYPQPNGREHSLAEQGVIDPV
jgi:hypothetical protein